MANVEYRKATKSFPGGVVAVDGLDLTIEDGEFVVIVGPSGCGKSTALRMVAGLDTISEGEIRIGGERVNEQRPQERDVAMVFQNYALYPHKSVRKNMEFPLRMMGLEREEIEKRVGEAADLLGIGDYLDRRPTMLSGGQQQRVAMGRAIVRDPAAFLMDEPLSNLDAKMRVEIRAEIADLQRKIGITTIYVTHDQVEAMTLGDRIAILDKGKLQQVAPAQDVYDWPANVFVATFIGSPSMNVFRSKLRRAEGDRFEAQFGERWLPLAAERLREESKVADYVDREVLLGLRPEAFGPAEDAPEELRLEVEAHTAEALGHERIVYFKAPVKTLRLKEEEEEGGSGYGGEEKKGKAETMVARLPAGDVPKKGEKMQLGLEMEMYYLFGPDGQAIL